MYNPLVSIVMPVYNGANYMRESIDSALNQTYQNIEVIVVNDGSTDGTDAVAKSYGDKIRYFAKENGGVGSALNLALQHMKGEYYSWLSHDDVYHPDKVEKQVAYLRALKDKNVVLYADYTLMNGRSRVYNTVILDHDMLSSKPEYAVLRGSINGNTLLIPKKAFDDYGGFNEKLTCTQDYDKWAEILLTYRYVHIPEVLIKYRVHPGQDTQKNPKFITEGNVLWIKMMKEISATTMDRLEGSEVNFYARMYDFLKATPYGEATKYAQQQFALAVSKKKKDRFSVTFVAHSPAKEGAERAMISAIDGLLERNVYVYVILPTPGPIEEYLHRRGVDYGFRNVRPCVKSRWATTREIGDDIFSKALNIYSLLVDLNPDVVVSITSVILEGAIAAKLAGIPHIWSISEFGRKEHGIRYFIPEDKRLNFVDKYSDKIMFVSETLRRVYAEKINLEKLFVIPPILASEVLGNESTEEIESIFRNKKSLKLLLAGNIHGGKGQKDAILAIGELVRRGITSVELAIVGPIGDKRYYGELLGIIKRDGLGNYVKILPPVDNLIGYFRQSDAVLMCSVYESFGRVTAEAILCKKPVIGANSGATPELVIDSQNGFLYEPGDFRELANKIRYFIENKNDIQKFGDKGFEMIVAKLDDKRNTDLFYKQLYAVKGKHRNFTLSQGELINPMKETLGLQTNEARPLEKAAYWAFRKTIAVLRRIKHLFVRTLSNLRPE